MSMVVKNNLDAVHTLNTLNKNSSALQDSLAKVSSGMKINSAKDDAAQFAISEKMREQLRSLNQDSQNIQNDMALMKTAEGAVQSTVDILKTMKEKAIDAANDSNTDDDRATIQKELDQFIDQIDDNALVTFNGKYLIDGSQIDATRNITIGGLTVSSAEDVQKAQSARDTIIKGLSSTWVQDCLDLLDESFGLSFEDNGATVKEITVHFDEEQSSALAWVTSSFSGSTANKLELHVNMNYYNDINPEDENGATKTGSGLYLDRTLAHEFTHAVMSANIDDFHSLPKYIKEGTAELSHGADNRASTMVELLQNPTRLEATLRGTSDEGDDVYAAGFMILRYMAKAAVTSGSATSELGVIKDFMKELNENGASNLDNAIQTATGNDFTSQEDLITTFMTEINNASGFGYDLADTGYSDVDFENSTITFNPNGVFAFLKDNFGIDTKYYSNIYDPDTGAISGSDAGGNTPKDNENIVKESVGVANWKLPTEESTTYSGLKVIWPDGYVTNIDNDNNVTTTAEGDQSVLITNEITDKKLTFQHGTQANQAIHVGLFDMRAKALGLVDSDNNKVQVTTIEKANNAIQTFDVAIALALDQQTEIGSVERRLEFTGDNITTTRENTMGAESTIRDADMAKEMTNYTKNNVLLQAAQSMLAQANQNSSGVLSLLQ